tara:strand:+ start:449 stop:895 length:447 start_codon:yes stop_codon:yes gene_type:complete
MIVVAQRCSKSKVLVDNKIIAKIKSGLMLLVGVSKGDDYFEVDKVINKIIHLRIFNDENKKMNLSILDTKGSLMVISQFTLCGNIRKGRRPSYINAENPDRGLEVYEYMVNKFRDKGIETATGEFGSMMDIDLINQGPATFIIDSEKL